MSSYGKKQRYACSDGKPAEPGSAHYQWHRTQGTDPCPESRHASYWYAWTLRNPGRDPKDYTPQGPKNLNGHVCSDGKPSEPGGTHYDWHRNNGTSPCLESRYALNWYNWIKQNPHREPADYSPRVSPNLNGYECSDGKPSDPDGRHYYWHLREGTEPCPESRYAANWSNWVWAHPDRDPEAYSPRVSLNLNGYECSDGKPDAPGQRHYAWHIRNRIAPCPESIYAKNWHYWLRAHPDQEPDDYVPGGVRVSYECSDEIPDELDRNHYAWHKHHGTDPCPKSRYSNSWYEWTRRNPYLDPNDYTPQGPLNLNGHVCSDGEPSEPGRNHYWWHQYHGTAPCPESRYAFSWSLWLKNNPGKAPADYVPGGIRVSYECSDGKPSEPGGGHYGWHEYYGTTPCPESRHANSWAEWAKRNPGCPLEEYDYTPVNLDGYVCSDGKPDEPNKSHYGWHHRQGTVPCPESRYALNWASWIDRNPHMEPNDYIPQNTDGYECSDEEPTEPSGAHYSWHQKQGTDPCPESRYAKKWYSWVWDHPNQNPADYSPYNNMDGYICSEDNPSKPDGKHYSWHQHNGTEPCPESRYAANWLNWLRNNPDAEPGVYVPGGPRVSYECSDGKPSEPGGAHYWWHRKQGTEPCPASLYAMRWHYWAQKNPTLDPVDYLILGDTSVFDREYDLYQYSFADGSVYAGITSLPQYYRERGYRPGYPIHEMLNSDTPYYREVLASGLGWEDARRQERELVLRLRREHGDKVLNRTYYPPAEFLLFIVDSQ